MLGEGNGEIIIEYDNEIPHFCPQYLISSTHANVCRFTLAALSQLTLIRHGA